MKLNAPVIITARLMAGLKVGADSYISIEYAGHNAEGRTVYRYFIDTPDFEFTGEDLKSGCGGGNIQEGLSSLLSFLGAAAETFSYNGHEGYDEEDNTFPVHVAEWADNHEDDISMLSIELEENKNLIEE